MSGLIDSHTHLESFARRGELQPVLDRARAAGLARLITIGTSTDDWDLYGTLADEHRGFVHHTVGLHPCAVDATWPEQLARLPPHWTDPRCGLLPVALGECGLDRFHLPKDDAGAAARIYGWQREAFAAQLALARQLGCPIVVHSRGAFAECVEMIDTSGVDWTRVVFHCFTEGPEAMAALLERGGFGSFTGILTYKTAEAIRAAATRQGLERLMLETDAPYLTPMPHRGKPNEPAYLRHTAEYAARHFSVGVEKLIATTAATTRRFFGL